MARKDLQKRANWQRAGGDKAALAEQDFYNVFETCFKGSPYEIVNKPKDMGAIYNQVELPKATLAKIFNPKPPSKGTFSWGIAPDYAIRNNQTKKTLYIEIKRQDGWVEGGKPADGRGNAHERSCKFFTPGLLQVMRTVGGIKKGYPFWVVLQGNITRDPRRTREIYCWYKGAENHFYMWRPNEGAKEIIAFFNKNLKPLLD
jgi:hypothetical protein